MAIQNILIVDDSPTERYYLTDILVKNGFNVTTAENGEEALAKIKEQKPQLILMDVVMPGANGFQVTRAIARDPDLTDNTLSGDLALLDRAMRELTGANPRAQHWRARLVAHSEDQEAARNRCEALQAFIVAFLQDAGVTVVGSAVHVADSVTVRFRPAMGQVHTATSGTSSQ